MASAKDNGNKKLMAVYESIEKAEASIRHAKSLLTDLSGVELPAAGAKYAERASGLKTSAASTESTGRVVEGIFDGQNMVGADKKSYPVPANYASKSKLVPGDNLKLSIMDDGGFIYKQIGPVPRKRLLGTLTYDSGQYMVVCEEKTYKVLLASVTYFKAEVGQTVTLLVPEFEDSEWGAIENVVTNPGVEAAVKEAEKGGDETFDIETAK